MGRAPRRTDRVVGLPLLFDADELPEHAGGDPQDFKSLRHPLWTENKAKLIQEYIRLFTFVTKHGTYIDGFAAPQRRNLKDLCSANLVLQAQPQWVRELWLCDIDREGIDLLREIEAEQANAKRKIAIIEGDFNSTIDQILGAGTIGEKQLPLRFSINVRSSATGQRYKKSRSTNLRTKSKSFIFSLRGGSTGQSPPLADRALQNA